jgi:hypothetical protein
MATASFHGAATPTQPSIDRRGTSMSPEGMEIRLSVRHALALVDLAGFRGVLPLAFGAQERGIAAYEAYRLLGALQLRLELVR